MGFRIQHNIEAMNAQKNLGISSNMMSKALERLSSGYRINKASDDATGLAQSTMMRVEIASLNAASRNVEQANADIQIAEGAYDQIANILTRLSELATQAGGSQVEADELIAEVDRIASGIGPGSRTIQVGSDASSNSQITIEVGGADATTLGIAGLTAGISPTSIGTINTAVSRLSTSRAALGAGQNRLSYAAANLKTTVENKTASESVIRDVDMASEMSNFTKSQILLQAGTAMLAQANMASQSVLSLLG